MAVAAIIAVSIALKVSTYKRRLALNPGPLAHSLDLRRLLNTPDSRVGEFGNAFVKGEYMISTAISAALALSTPANSPSDWELACLCPLDLLIQDLRQPQPPAFAVPGTPMEFRRAKQPAFSITLMPDIVAFQDAVQRPNQSFSFSHETSPNGFKGQILRRLGLVEEHARGFGATFRFASARNWAFQFKGMRKFTVAYVTRF